MTDLPKQYDPAAAQAKWFPFWESHGYFDADPDPAGEKPSHTIMIPLPNVTGALHMGHALNGTLQDLLTRWRRMQGYEALWMPGTDHAGIATQAVVERRMFEEEGLTRHDVGREALVNRIWAWKDAYEKRIIGQQKSLGASCDWRRLRFTLDDVCSRAVRRTFFKLFKDGLIYRGKRLVNWDVHLQTAVSDDEVYHETTQGHFWHIRYPVIDPQPGEPTHVTIATTRPETLLGDTAVAVHPDPERQLTKVLAELHDKLGAASAKEKPAIEKQIAAIENRRQTHLPGLIRLRDMAAAGRMLELPLLGRRIPLVADEWAKPELGSGCVKITPAHDHNDAEVGQRRNLPAINILNPDGTLNAEAGRYAGLSMSEGRARVVAGLELAGLLAEVEDREIELAYSDRSKTAIEPYLSDQWFVKMDDHADGRPGLAQSAIDAVEDGRVRFHPSRYAKTYLDWLGEKRDWCISRQLWWGHRIPVWSLGEALKQRADDVAARLERLSGNEESGPLSVVERTDGPYGDGTTLTYFLVCVDEGRPEIERELEELGFEQDPDVLDTWFSSALWPHATLGWPDTQHDPPIDEEYVTERGTKPSTLNPQPSTENEVLDDFYPGSVLVTARDIITLWVARMVLTGLYNMDDVPFHHVCVHPNLQDGFGQKMSKSKGNGVDPLDLIDKYGTDAVRFTIASFAGETQDVRLPISYECPHCEELVEPKLHQLDTITVVVPSTMKGQLPIPAGAPKPVLVCPNKKCKRESQFTTPLYDPDDGEPVARMVSERFEYGRNFCNKLWNASRFALMNLAEGVGRVTGPDGTEREIPLSAFQPLGVSEEEMRLEDRWILSRLSTVAAELDELLGRYQFDNATRVIREFTWNEFCDWYLEMVKPRLRDPGLRSVAQQLLVAVLDALLRLLHPFVPFITEELWQRLNDVARERNVDRFFQSISIEDLVPEPAAEAIIVAPWPRVPESWRDAALESRFARLQETIVAVRNVRAVYNIDPRQPVPLHVRCEPAVAGELRDVADQFDNLAKAILEQAGAEVIRPPSSAGFTIGDADGFVPLEGLIDREAELERQTRERDKLRGFITGHERKLSNESFVAKAPPEVVADVRETLDNLRKQLESVEQIVRDLGGN
jgi:valyl-tRNA synthetase